MPINPSHEGGPAMRPAESGGRLSQFVGYVAMVDAASFSIHVGKDFVQDPAAAHLIGLGAVLKVKSGNAVLFATVSSAASLPDDGLDLRVDFLGELRDGTFSRGVRDFPLPGSPAFAASARDHEAIYAPPGGDTLRIGTVFGSDGIPAALRAEALLSRHFAVLGSTGTGKSCGVALMIHRLVERCPGAHIVVLDPHNEYARAFAGNGIHVSTGDLKLPYWLMNFEEHVELLIGRDTRGREAEVDILKRCLFGARKKSGPTYSLTRLTVDTPIPYKLTDLLQAIDDELGRLDKAEQSRPFLRLRNKIEELRADGRYAYMFSGMLMQDTLTELVSKLLRFPVAGRPVTTLDLSGVPADIVDVVVSLLCRLVFDFAMWSRRQAGATPLLLVCEEAHRYVPREGLDNRIQAARKALERIAKEGRKYGVSLGLVSQRPSDLSEAVLSQCGTIVSMRMNNERDRNYVASAMPEGARGFLSVLPSLQNRECLVAGEGVACPVRVELDPLEDDKRPASDDPRFTESWRQDIDCLQDLVNDTIANWRRGVR